MQNEGKGDRLKKQFRRQSRITADQEWKGWKVEYKKYYEERIMVCINEYLEEERMKDGSAS